MTSFDSYRTQALKSAKLLTTEIRVLYYVLPDLNGLEFRTLPQAEIAKALHLSQPRVSRALQTLVDEQCLEIGARAAAGNVYRLNLTHTQIEGLVDERRDNSEAA